LPNSDEIPAKLIKVGGKTLCSEIHRMILSIWNKEKFPKLWKESIIVPTVVIIKQYHSYYLHTVFYAFSGG
jgi:hypothetical protein